MKWGVVGSSLLAHVVAAVQCSGDLIDVHTHVHGCGSSIDEPSLLIAVLVVCECCGCVLPQQALAKIQTLVCIVGYKSTCNAGGTQNDR